MGVSKASGRSMFGVQHESKKSTAPIYGFGSADRSAMEKVFMTAEHAKSSYGKNSPGPIYELKSTMGKQSSSKNESSPLFSFGTADRFQKAGTKRISGVPGPGAYQAPSALARQVNSSRVSAPEYGFGSSTRDHQEKLFLSAEQAKTMFGVGSPGPSAYNSKSSVGKQSSSKNESAPSWAFCSEERFKYDYVERAAKIPGAGQYSYIGACVRQQDSQKVSLPTYSFGTSTRARRDKVYVSPEHEKSHFGECSPGPASIGPSTSFGQQQSSKKTSASSWKFGSSRRIVYNESRTPGPGAYD